MLTGNGTQPKPLGSISLEAFLAKLRFEQRQKLAELNNYGLLKKEKVGLDFYEILQ